MLSRALTNRAVRPAVPRWCTVQAAAEHAVATPAPKQAWRPSRDDVERISRGQAAKTRGTGSRGVPHRLNAEERKLFELAKQKGFLVLRGSGYRRERKGSPLANTFRQWCDAARAPAVLVSQGAGGVDPLDTVLLDLSPLRLPSPVDVERVSSASAAIAAVLGCAPVPAAAAPATPFTITAPQQGPAAAMDLYARADSPTAPASSAAPASGSETVNSTPSVPSTAEGALPQEASSGGPGAEGSAATQANAASSSQTAVAPPPLPPASSTRRDGRPAPLPIWQLPAQPLYFECARPTAKKLAAALVAGLSERND